MKNSYKNFVLNKSRTNSLNYLILKKTKKTNNKTFFSKYSLIYPIKFKEISYKKIPSLCNKQGKFKRSFKYIYFNRHVLLKKFLNNDSSYLNKTLEHKKW